MSVDDFSLDHGKGGGGVDMSTVTKFRGMALNGLFCVCVLQPLDFAHSLTLPTNTTLTTDIRRLERPTLQ